MDTNEINVNEEITESTEATETKTYTEEEFLAKLQSEVDKRVTGALKTQAKKYEKQISDMHSLEGLDASEREKQQLKNENAELKELVSQYTIERNRSELKSVLSSRGLSAEFADIINISDDIQASQANIDLLDKLFKSAVKAEVEKRLAGNAPKGNGGAPAEITKDDAKKMSVDEMSELASKNPELFNKLFN